MFLTTLILRLHFKLFFALFLITPWGTEFNSISEARGSRSGFQSSKAYAGKFRSRTLPAVPDGIGCIQLLFGPLCTRNNALTKLLFCPLLHRKVFSFAFPSLSQRSSERHNSRICLSSMISVL